ncbi:hypothetical protein GGR26_001515 [Lewinella marina]|uniref:Uncharacterized protein n=1 Tax=Neolewinella marina TaxID=438751 RepID=A0A2G0CFZ1_9BACT|nr:hypothetical protein [Neolewinella marina]NJB85770.1 hypothetical protein [Neolewinella marina]PHK98904.1 hypothetical protein CGL56_08770 [Neolewinella marina]
MLDDILSNARNAISGLATSVGEGTREKTAKLLEDWLQIFPILSGYGLEITSFSMTLGLSPALNVELLGKHGDWTEESIQERMTAHRGDTALTTVFTAIRTAYRLQRQTKAPLRDPLILKIIVRITPEVRVVLGQPILED